MLQFLTTPTAAEFHQMTVDPALQHQARKIMNSLHDLVQAVSPLSIIAIAQGLNPDKSAGEALTLMQTAAEHAMAAVKCHTDHFKDLSSAERDRLAPMKSTATRRLFDIQYRLNAMAANSASSERAIQDQRKKLQDAQISQADIDRLAPTFDPATANAGAVEMEALKNELAALESFLKTSDESHLPAGFVVSVPLKVGQLKSMEAQ